MFGGGGGLSGGTAMERTLDRITFVFALICSALHLLVAWRLNPWIGAASSRC